MTIPVGGRLPRLRRQAWVFWAVIVATVVMALASVAYAGRNLTVAFPSAVAVGSHPTGKLPIGAGAQAPHTVTVVQPSHPVEVLDGGDGTSSSSSAAASSQSTAPATVESGNPQAGSAMASAPTSVDESPIASPPPAGPGSGTGTTGATSTTTTTTTVATTTTTTWGESDDGPDRSATTTRSGTRTGDE